MDDPRARLLVIPADPSAGLRALLRERTLDTHRRLHRALDSALTTVDGYVAFLRGTLAAIDAARSALVALGVIGEGGARDRVARLTADLAALGARPLDPPAHLYVPATVGQGQGAAYVIEGSAVGGRVVSARLSRELGLCASSRSYLEVHGGATLSRQAFNARLDAWGLHAGAEGGREAVTGATAMFWSYREAFTAAGLTIEATP